MPYGAVDKLRLRPKCGVAAQARDYLALEVPVGPYLADQLLVPLAIAGKGRFCTGPPTRHTRINMDIIKQFMGVDCRLSANTRGQWEIAMQTNPDGSKSV